MKEVEIYFSVASARKCNCTALLISLFENLNLEIFLHYALCCLCYSCNSTAWSVYEVSFLQFVALDVSEDPFGSRQEESSEVTNQNSWVENVLQRNRDLSFAPRDNQERVFSRSARSFISEEILEALRKADRKGRDVVVGLSNACCKWGCSKSEISSLC